MTFHPDRHCRPITPLLLLVASLLAAQFVLADPVDDYVRKQMSANHIPGIELIVLKSGKLVKEQGYGFANLELRVPPTKDTVFPLASVTKVFTATAVYLLVQEGRLRLDEKVTTILPGLPAAWNEITVLNCLTHTTGLQDFYSGSPALAPTDWVAASTEEEALRKISALPLRNKTGERSIYDQAGFLLLKLIVERKSGMPLQDFLAQRIFHPLEMRSAQFGDSLDVIPNRASVYMNFIPEPDRFHVQRQANGDGLSSPDGRLWNDFFFVYPSYQYGGVGLNMSAADLATFDTALVEGKVLDRAALQSMWAPFHLNNGQVAEFAGGWDTAMLNGHRLVFHIGAGMVEYAHLIDGDVTVILLANNNGFNPYRMTIGVLQFFAPETRISKD